MKTNPFNVTSANRVISGPASGFIQAKIPVLVCCGTGRKKLLLVGFNFCSMEDRKSREACFYFFSSQKAAAALCSDILSGCIFYFVTFAINVVLIYRRRVLQFFLNQWECAKKKKWRILEGLCFV